MDKDTSKKWKITTNKSIYTKIYIKGLPADTKVWIDNLHTNAYTIALSDPMNEIIQDSLGDRIHNSLMYGFPISDNVYHYAKNQIEGLNKEFIEGNLIGFSSIESGYVEQKRYTEVDYLSAGVYANLIPSAYGLLIQKGDNEPYGVDVSSEILVLINNKVQLIDSTGMKQTYIFDRAGNIILEGYREESVEENKVNIKK